MDNTKNKYDHHQNRNKKWWGLNKLKSKLLKLMSFKNIKKNKSVGREEQVATINVNPLSENQVEQMGLWIQEIIEKIGDKKSIQYDDFYTNKEQLITLPPIDQQTIYLIVSNLYITMYLEIMNNEINVSFWEQTIKSREISWYDIESTINTIEKMDEKLLKEWIDIDTSVIAMTQEVHDLQQRLWERKIMINKVIEASFRGTMSAIRLWKGHDLLANDPQDIAGKDAMNHILYINNVSLNKLYRQVERIRSLAQSQKDK